MVTLQNDTIQQLTDLCLKLEGLAAAPPPDVEAEIAAATGQWTTLGGEADAALSDRCARAVEALRAAGRQATQVDADVPVATISEPEASPAAPEDPPQAVEDVPVATMPEPDAGPAAAEEPPPAPAEPLSDEEHAARVGQLSQMLNGAAQLLAATDLPDARARWTALRREWTTLRHGLTLDEALQAKLADVEGQIESREADLREARTHQQQQNLARLQQLCDQLEKLSQAERIALRDVERALREVRTALDAPGPLPSRQDQQAIVARLKAVQSSLFPRVQDLREADEWERWANAGVQDGLVKKLEALREEADLAVVAKQLRHVQEEWRKVKAVPREKGRELWQRYKTVEAEIRTRCEDYFQQMAAERADSLHRKEQLCEQAEALAGSTDWIRTAETIKGLQAQWKEIGPVTPGHEKAIWERFRAACDQFFTRRKDDLSERKVVWTANLQQKEALCQQIETLAETTEWDRAMLEVKRLQADWRAIGPVKRNRAEAILLRFRAACEKFFDAYAHRNDRETAQQAEVRGQLVARLEALVPSGDGELAADPEALAKDVLALKRQWDQMPALPREQGEALASRYATALAGLVRAYGAAFGGTELDSEQNRKRLEQLCRSVEGLLGDEKSAAQLSPAAILATQWREALAANTIGGRVDDEARWRTGADEVKKAQAAWRRVGPVADPAARELEERFQHACQAFFKQRDLRRKPSSGPGR